MLLQNSCRTSLNFLTLISPGFTSSTSRTKNDVNVSSNFFFVLKKTSLVHSKSYLKILSPLSFSFSSLNCANFSSDLKIYNTLSRTKICTDYAPSLKYGKLLSSGKTGPFSEKNHKRQKIVCFKIRSNALHQVGLGQKQLKKDEENDKEEDEEDDEDEDDEYDEAEGEGEGETEAVRRIERKPRRFPLLGNKEKKELRAFAHQLGKKLKMQQVGKWGVTPTLATAIGDALEANEILKMKVLESCPEDVQDVAWKLEDMTDSQVIGKVGRTLILYRPSLTKMEEAKQARLRAEKRQGDYQRRSGGGRGFSSRGRGRSRRD